ncbi:MAG: DUF4386 family protein [Acidimicrobiia bacterium]
MSRSVVVESHPAPVTINWVPIGGWAGVLFVLTFLVAAIFSLAPAPAGADGADVIRQWAVDEGTTYLTFMWVANAMNVVFLLPFAAAFSRVVDGRDRVLARLIMVGATASAVTATVGTAFSASLALGSAVDLADSSIVAFWRADNFIFLVVLGAFQALLMAAGSMVIYHWRIAPRWLGLLGLVAAGLLMLDGMWVVSGDFSSIFQIVWLVGLAGFAVWVVGVSIGMIRGAVHE